MFEFLKKSVDENAFVALDIGADVIKAAVFSVEEKRSSSGEVTGKRGIIRGFSKVGQRLGDLQSGTIADIASIVRRAKEAIDIASRMAGLKPKDLVLGIAGEFVKGATSTLDYQREEPESKINIAELRNIVQKLQWRAFADIRKELSEEMGYPEIDVKLVNTSMVDVRIDGYKVTNPLGFQGKEIQMSIFNSFAPLGHFGAIQGIADDLGLTLLGIISEPFALSRCIHFEEGDLSAIFIDVGGVSTDLAVVQNGCVMGTKMFAIGGRTFTKRLAMELNISLPEAENLKLAFTEDKLEQKSKKIVQDFIDSDMEIWLEGVTLALSEFKNITTFPSKILLSGGGSQLPEVKVALNTRKWYADLPFARAPEARFILPKEITNVIDETKLIKDHTDIIPMALVSVGIDLAGEESILQKALKKAVGIMQV